MTSAHAQSRIERALDRLPLTELRLLGGIRDLAPKADDPASLRRVMQEVMQERVRVANYDRKLLDVHGRLFDALDRTNTSRKLAPPALLRRRRVER